MEDRHPPTSGFALAGILLVLTCGIIPLRAWGETLPSLWPAIIALVMVFTTRSAALALLTACLAGIILLATHPDSSTWIGWADPAGGTLRGALVGPWHLGAIVFTLVLGAFAAVVERSGGLRSLLRGDATPSPQTQRRFLTSVFGLGLLCFFDGLANSIMLGRVARPTADRLRVPRALLAYLVDTTSSAVACLAFISTWIGTQLSLIAEHSPVDQPAYELFFSSIPHNFYCLFSLLLAFLVIRRHWLIGPMGRRRANDDSGKSPPHSEQEVSSLHRALIPLLILVFSIPLAIHLIHALTNGLPLLSLTSEGIRSALNSSAVPTAFIVGSAIALLSAIAFYPRQREQRVHIVALQGALQLIPPLLILVLAWILGSLFSALGSVSVLADLIGTDLPLAWFPAVVFLLGCLTSFVSGTSWGTMAILMSLALPTAGSIASLQGVPPDVLAEILPAVIAAVFGGAVFGDHCSPYSDTTIVSALACGISTREHTITQLPYALIAAGAALVAGYLPLALGLPVGLSLLLGCSLLIALVFLIRPSRSYVPFSN